MPVHSHWPCGSYPILVNPTKTEIEKFGKDEVWDTLRIVVDSDDDSQFAVGSGHGNTHTSVTKGAYLVTRKFILPDSYILFIEDKQFFFNLEDVMGGRKVRAAKAIPSIGAENVQFALEILIDLRRKHWSH